MGLFKFTTKLFVRDQTIGDKRVNYRSVNIFFNAKKLILVFKSFFYTSKYSCNPLHI